MRKIKVLIVDDSPTITDLLSFILGSDPEIEVIGTAFTGKKAIEELERLSPDIVTMDINMPEMDGIEATKKIMETFPLPIVIVSASWHPKEVEKTFNALMAGALTLIEKPRGIGHPDHNKMAMKLIETVKAMSKVKVVRRWPQKPAMRKIAMPMHERQKTYKCVAIGLSTGGPTVLQEILANIPNDFAIPILIVQHISEGFLPGLVKWLKDSTGFDVRIARHGEELKKSTAYLSPDGFHLGVNEKKICLSNSDPVNNIRPSVSYLFDSVANAFDSQSIGVLLTGMGRDGVGELKTMKDKGALTIIQSEESALIFGMPGEAKKINAHCYELNPLEIAEKLTFLNQNNVQ